MLHCLAFRKRIHRLLLRWLLLGSLFLGMCWISPPAYAAPVDPNVTQSSGSVPQLNATADGWDTGSLNTAQATPTKNGFTVVYNQTDFGDNPFPIQTSGTCAGGTCVRFRPGSTGLPPDGVECTLSAAVPEFSTSNAGQCFYRVDPISGDRIQIYYMGLLAEGEPIRYTIDGLLPPPAGSGDFQPFDSDDPNPGTAVSDLTFSGTRDPAQFMLVLDKSGSMRWSSHPQDSGCSGNIPVTAGDTCGPSRWEKLTESVNIVLDVAKAYAISAIDEFGVSFFDGSLEAPYPDPTTVINITENNICEFREGRGLVPDDPDCNVPVTAVLPGGSTSIGAGLEHFESLAPGSPNVTETVIVMTDGEQNTTPYVIFNAGGANPVQYSNDGTSGGSTGEVLSDFNICPFAMIPPDAAASTTPLDFQQISDERCNNENLMTIDISGSSNDTLTQFFLQGLNNTLIGDKLELAQVSHGELTAGGNEEAVETFLTSKDDIAFTVLLTWAENFNGLRKLVLAKDGIEIPLLNTAAAKVEQGQTHLAATFHTPFCDDSGNCIDSSSNSEWKLLIKPYFEVPDFHYNLFVDVDNATIASEFRAEQSTPGIGEPFTLFANLTEQGKPITGLPPKSVVAIVGRPGASLGNILSKADIDPDDLQTDTDDSISAAGRKVSAMLANPDFRKDILSTLEAQGFRTIVLEESDPGLYKADYNDTITEGVYPIQFLVDAKTAKNGYFKRNFFVTRHVAVAPDPEVTASNIKVASLSRCSSKYAGGCFSISLRPVDQQENLLGPGKEKLFSLPDFRGDILAPFTDQKLNGVYTANVGFPEGVSGLELIDIGGVKIPIDVPAKQSNKYEYSAQIMCGRKKGSSSNYDTTITVHNSNIAKSSLSIDLVLASSFSTKNRSKTISIGDARLGRNEALTIDCDFLKKKVFNGKFPNNFLNGVVVIDSPSRLQVNTTYTTLPRFRWLGTNGIYMREIPERPFRFDDVPPPTLNRD